MGKRTNLSKQAQEVLLGIMERLCDIGDEEAAANIGAIIENLRDTDGNAKPK